MIIPVFLPHGGCPERCYFCDQKVSGGKPAAAGTIAKVIDEHLSTGGGASEVAFYGGTFTAYPKEKQREYLDAVRPYLDDGRVHGLRVSTRPDAVEASWLCELRARYRLRTVELGAQSASDGVLKALGRSHSVQDTERAAEVIRAAGLDVGLQMMIGCPGEVPGHDELTRDWLLRLRPTFVRIHPLIILPGTELDRQFKAGAFKPVSFEAAVSRTAGLVEALETAGVRVVRLGLQPNDLMGAVVVAGPYHPSFGDLVRGRICRNRLEKKLLDLRPGVQGSQVTVCGSKRAIGILKGHGGIALNWLRERFNLCSIEVDVIQEGPPYEPEIEVRIHHPAGPA